MTTRDTPRLRIVPQNVPLEPAEAPAKAPAGRERKRRNPHRGVKLIRPSGTKSPYWRVRYADLETGKTRFERVPAEHATSIETRRDYAIALHKRLAKRRDEITAGAAPHRSADALIAAVFDLYFESWAKQNREVTQREYRRGCDQFLAWCATPAVNVRTVRQLSKGLLRLYAGSRVASPLQAVSGRTGPRAPSTINKELRWLSAVLGELRTMEKIHLTRDDIADGLARIAEPINKRDFCRVAELRAILDTCRRFDAVPPRKGGRPGQCNGRMLPIVLFLLLTGMRVDEAVWIQWSDIVLDDDGRPQIVVPADVSKTRVARVIDTEHSPLLAALISAPNGRTGTILGATESSLFNARQKLIDEFGAPKFDYQKLRCTCGTYLTCAPSIWGTASPYMSARQLGHSVEIAQKHYTGVVKVSRDARTTEAAMQLEIDPATVPKL